MATSAAGAISRAGGQSRHSDRTPAPISEEALAAKVDDVAEAIGQIADRVLKFVSDRMPGLEAWAISTLDTIFAPRLVLR